MALSTRLRDEAGFGLVELLIAMTVMVVGITALVAALSSGIVAVKRAGDASTAAAVVDKQMEAYRALPNCAVYLDGTTIPTSGPYVTAGAYSSTQIVAGSTLTEPLLSSGSCPAAPSATSANAHQQLTGADGRLYWVDAYIVEVPSQPAFAQCADGADNDGDTKVDLADPGCASAADKYETTPPVARKVTLIVRDPADATNTKSLLRETATFAPPTGCTNPPADRPNGC